eukprot:Nk52_evm34s621 gene=Nk52_evmTU34s621
MFQNMGIGALKNGEGGITNIAMMELHRRLLLFSLLLFLLAPVEGTLTVQDGEDINAGSEWGVTVDGLRIAGNVSLCRNHESQAYSIVGCSCSELVDVVIPGKEFSSHSGLWKVDNCSGTLTSGIDLIVPDDKVFFEVNLRGISLSEERFPKFPFPEAIEILDISFNMFTALPEQMKEFVNLKYFTAIKNHIANLTAPLLNQEKLVRIDMAYNLLTTFSVPFSNSTELVEINFSHNCIESANIEASFPGARKLVNIVLGNNFFTKAANLHIAQLSEINQNISIDLSGNFITSLNKEGISQICGGLKPCLKCKCKLNLTDNMINHLFGDFLFSDAVDHIILDGNRIRSLPNPNMMCPDGTPCFENRTSTIEVMSLKRVPLSTLPPNFIKVFPDSPSFEIILPDHIPCCSIGMENMLELRRRGYKMLKCVEVQGYYFSTSQKVLTKNSLSNAFVDESVTVDMNIDSLIANYSSHCKCPSEAQHGGGSFCTFMYYPHYSHSKSTNEDKLQGTNRFWSRCDVGFLWNGTTCYHRDSAHVQPSSSNTLGWIIGTSVAAAICVSLFAIGLAMVCMARKDNLYSVYLQLKGIGKPKEIYAHGGPARAERIKYIHSENFYESAE